MKQAVCLLAYKDINYIQKFIDQFENNKDIYFYIHWHTHSEEECRELYKTSSNIKCVINNFNTVRFGFDLIHAELYLYELALNDDMDYFHLMSESDYIICTPQYFCNFFNDNKHKDFIGYIDDERVAKINKRYVNELIYPIAKASQWKSLCKQTVFKLINNFKNEIHNVINNYLYMANQPDYYSNYVCGAVDEFILPTVLKYVMKLNSDSNMRYVNWENVDFNVSNHPNTLIYSLLNDTNYVQINEEIICKNLVIRKIDIENIDCIKLLNYLKLRFNDYNINI